jgi:hypothetical protein
MQEYALPTLLMAAALAAPSQSQDPSHGRRRPCHEPRAMVTVWPLQRIVSATGSTPIRSPGLAVRIPAQSRDGHGHGNQSP